MVSFTGYPLLVMENWFLLVGVGGGGAGGVPLFPGILLFLKVPPLN